MRRELGVLVIVVLLLSPCAFAQDLVAGVDAVLQFSGFSVTLEAGNGVTWEAALSCVQDLLALDPALDAALQANIAQVEVDVPGGEAFLPGLFVGLATMMTVGSDSGNGVAEGWGEAGSVWVTGWAEGFASTFSGDTAYDTSQRSNGCVLQCFGVAGATCDLGGGEPPPAGDLAVEIDGSILLGLDRTKSYKASVTVPAEVASFETPTDFDVDIVYTWSGSDDQILNHPVTAATAAPLNDPIDFVTDIASQAYVPVVGSHTLDVTADAQFVGDDLAAETGEATIFVDVEVTLRETLSNPSTGPAQTQVLNGSASFVITTKLLDWDEDCEPLNRFLADIGLMSNPLFLGCAFDSRPFLNEFDFTNAFQAHRMPDSFQLALLAYSLCNKGVLDELPKDFTTQGFYNNPSDGYVGLQYETNLAAWEEMVENMAELDDFLVTERIRVTVDPDSGVAPLQFLVGTIVDFQAASNSPFPIVDSAFNWIVVDALGNPDSSVFFINPDSTDSSMATGTALDEGLAVVRVTGATSLLFNEASIVVIGPDTPPLDPNDPCDAILGPAASSDAVVSAGYAADLLAVHTAWTGLTGTEQDNIWNFATTDGVAPASIAASAGDLDKLMDSVLAEVVADVSALDGKAADIVAASGAFGFGNWIPTFAAIYGMDWNNPAILDFFWLDWSSIAAAFDEADFNATVRPGLMAATAMDDYINGVTSMAAMNAEALGEYIVGQMDINMTLYELSTALTAAEQTFADALAVAKATQDVLGSGINARQSEAHLISTDLPRPAAGPEPPSEWSINVNGAVATFAHDASAATIDAELETLKTLGGTGTADDLAANNDVTVTARGGSFDFEVDFSGGVLANTDVDFHADFSRLLQNIPPGAPWDHTVQNGAGVDASVVDDFSTPAFFQQLFWPPPVTPYGAGDPATGFAQNPLFNDTIGPGGGLYNLDGTVTLDHVQLATAILAAGGDWLDFVTAAVPLGGFWNGNPALPVGGVVGLGLLAGALASGGAVLIRRRKK